MQSAPLVTIGVPNYNYSHYVLQTLSSVAEQTYPHIELIVVDDCSTDASSSIINEWINTYKGNIDIRFILNEKNVGLAAVCNIILNNARGKYFQTLDADDLILPGKISMQVAALENEPAASFIYSNMGLIDGNGATMQEDYLQRIKYNESNMPQGDIFETLFDFNFIPLPTVLMNTEKARAAGGFRESLQIQDYHMWLKLAEKNKVLYQPVKTAFYRVHNTSMSNTLSTNLRIANSVLDIKYGYYKTVSPAIQKKIRKNIHFSTPYLYDNKFPTAGKWLRRDLLLSPGIKSVVYFTAYKLGIPFSFFAAIKNKLKKLKND